MQVRRCAQDYQESMEASTIKSICAVFENALSAHNGTPNEHILGVISVLFINNRSEHVLHLMVLESENVSIYVVVSFLLL
jgi:hypothetical protein